MRVGSRPVVVLILLTFGAAPAAPQSVDRPRFTTEASAVVLDVVVRDARGRPVTGLTREDFEVFEGRARQTITVFEGPAAQAPAGANAASSDPAAAPVSRAGATPPRVVALVFEQLGPAARDLASKAARRLVDSLGRGDFAGVFTVDRAIHAVANYAPASPPVLAAIEAAANRPGMPLRRSGVVSGAEFASDTSGQPTQETRDEAKRNRGFATLDALSQIIRGLSLLPGRKMVVLFSEGLALDTSEEVTQLPRADGPQPLDDSWLTDGRFERFRRLIEEANAAQVAFYTFDAAGLRTESPFASLSWGRAPYVGLLALAEGTGGAFVENTNDLAPGALRAADDQAHYYVLGYTPSKVPDGEYRELRVRARCDTCTVLARRGYRATSSRRARQVGVRDVAPFLLLDGDAAPTDLAVTLDARATGTRPAARAVSITATMLEAAATPGGVVTFLVRLTDARGKAIAVVSQHFQLRGLPGGEARLTFARAVPVPAQRGELALVVYDHASGRATVMRRPYDPSQ